MGEFHRALAAADLPPGQCAEVAVGGKAIALFNVDGTFYAMAEQLPAPWRPARSGDAVRGVP